MNRKFLLVFVALMALGVLAVPGFAQDGEVGIAHYFSGDLNLPTLLQIFSNFNEATGLTVVDNPIGHEDFKTGIPASIAAGNLPDVFSYWAGARTQFAVDAGALLPIDEYWDAAGLDEIVPASVANSSTLYNGSRYLVPFNIHYAGFFYNPKVWAEAGIDVPDTWDGLLEAFAEFEMKGIDPVALGSQNSWPAQFWFDYLLLRTAGPDYRSDLMTGAASYEDAEVVRAMELWQSLVDSGYFVDNANAYNWTDAADMVANGDAAVTLMGTWIGGYWKGQGLTPGEDYDFFVFPAIEEGVPQAVVGPVDGWVMTIYSNPDEAWQLLNFFISDVETQSLWNSSYGSLSPNNQVDSSIYDVVAAKAGDTIANASHYVFNYDLATPPQVDHCGLTMFQAFMNDPSSVTEHLADTQECAAEGFASIN